MCEYAVLLSGHIDQMNTAEEEARLQAHLPQCAHCRELLRQMEENDAALRALSAEPSEELTARIMNAVRSQPRKRRLYRRVLPLTAVAAAAALIFAFSGTISSLFMSKDAAANECAPYSAMYRHAAEDFVIGESALNGTGIDITKGTFRGESTCAASSDDTVVNTELGDTADGMLLFHDAERVDTAEIGGWLADWLPAMRTLLGQTLS